MPLSHDVLKKYVSSSFVETGSLEGDGIQQAIDCGFQEVYSVEIIETYVNKCRERFKSHSNVHVFHGDSMTILPKIVNDISGSVTFWLDAHINAKREPVLGKKSCPILEEIDIAMSRPDLKKILLIDDMRLFRGNGVRKWGWVTEQNILDTIKKHGNYQISYENGHRPNDIMVVKLHE